MKMARYDDLIAQYENPIEHACDMRLGQVFIADGWQKPDGLCQSAWESMSPFVMALSYGAEDFYDGWRIYRVQPKIMERNNCCIRFTYARFHYVELYVNGQLIDTVDEYINGEYKTPFFTVEPNTVADIRILMRTENGNPRYGAGLAGVAEMCEK